MASMVLSDNISFMAALSSLEAPTKLVPLSDSRVWGAPLLALNCWRAAMKAAVEASDSNSMCTALVVMHTKRQAKVFSRGAFLP